MVFAPASLILTNYFLPVNWALAVLNMYRIKRARSVIHSLAHHGVSALSWLHPRLGEECKKSEVPKVTFDLILGVITTSEFNASKETLSTYRALKVNFDRILNSENIDLSSVQSASITFGFRSDSYPSFCICKMVGIDEKEIDIKVDWCGNKYNLLSECKPYS